MAAAVGTVRSVAGGVPIVLNVGQITDRDVLKQAASSGADAIGSSKLTQTQESGTEPPSIRHVVRKVSIDLIAEDVRGAYLKVLKMLPNEADGEYVEQAQLYGNSAQATAYLTVRVRASRLSAALNMLRELGD